MIKSDSVGIYLPEHRFVDQVVEEHRSISSFSKSSSESIHPWNLSFGKSQVGGTLCSPQRRNTCRAKRIRSVSCLFKINLNLWFVFYHFYLLQTTGAPLSAKLQKPWFSDDHFALTQACWSASSSPPYPKALQYFSDCLSTSSYNNDSFWVNLTSFRENDLLRHIILIKN